MLNLLLPLSGTTSDLSNLNLQIKAYVTKEKEQTEDYLTQPRTIWFKPNATDSPISPSLGNNGWLWLGAIIASSFIGFLIFIGLLTKYYIYPIDHNTNKIYPQAAKTIYYVLILCGCMMVAASGAFLWNKKRNAMETKQIMSMEGITPQATPESRFYNADRELESLPHQSILESTEVHYGGRPDLKSKPTLIVHIIYSTNPHVLSYHQTFDSMLFLEMQHFDFHCFQRTFLNTNSFN